MRVCADMSGKTEHFVHIKRATRLATLNKLEIAIFAFAFANFVEQDEEAIKNS